MRLVFAWIPGTPRLAVVWPAGLLMFVSLLVPQCGWATSEAKDCIPEPTLNMPIAYGDVLSGGNCVITVLDLDSFVFTAAANDQIRLVAQKTGGGYYAVPCVELRDPDGVQVATVCTTSIQIDQKLTKPGTYKITVTESGNDDSVNYDLSLTRIVPFPASAPAIKWWQVLPDEINPPTDLDPFVFFGTSGDLVRILALKTGGGYYAQVCIEVFQPDSTLLGQKLCGTSIQTPDTTLTQTGQYMILVSESSNDDVVTYSLAPQCLDGVCTDGQPPTPQCKLQDTVSYDAASGTLTAKFLIGNPYAVTWNGWLSYQNTVVRLWSAPQAVTDPPAAVTKTLSNIPKLGRVGVLSTLTTPKNGITCASWVVVNTGTPGTAASEEALIDTPASQTH